MNIKQALAAILDHQHLSEDDMVMVMQDIMTGETTPAQIGAFLMGLRMKGETVPELVGAARVMRSLATSVPVKPEWQLVDTCGTGGDGANTFNVSTAAAFVVAAAGGKVAKHGNRSVSSVTGSADVLEQAGVCLTLSPDQVVRCVDSIGVGFMFAPAHHSAMKHAIGPRKEMGVRTIFNVLGPLTNPAGAKRQVMGVFAQSWVRPVAEVLQRLGSEHVLVVHAKDGLDELSIASESYVAEVRPEGIQEYVIKPEEVGLQTQSLEGLAVTSAQQSLDIIKAVFAKQPGPAADIVCFNAGAAIYVAGLAGSLAEGVSRAQDAIGSGLAAAKLGELVELSQVLQQQNAESAGS